MDEPNSADLSDVEIALLDAIKTVMEIIMTTEIAKPIVFARMLGHQRDGYLAKKMPSAAAVMELLRTFAVDPQREAHREALRTILREQPKGSA